MSEETKDIQTKEQVQVDNNKTVIIDEDLVRQFPALRPLMGKEITELAKSYTELERTFTKSRQELSELKKQLEQPKQTETQSQDTKIPDPVEDPEGYRKYVIEEARKAALESISQTQQPTTTTPKQENPSTVFVYKQIEKLVPEVNGEWATQRFIDSLRDETGYVPVSLQRYYSENPDKLVDDVVRFSKEDILKAKINDAKSEKKTEDTGVTAQPEVSKEASLVEQLMKLNYRPSDWKKQ